MKNIKERLEKLKDGQVLQVYFDRFGKEDDDGEGERIGVHSRGAEAGYLDTPGDDRTVER